MTITLLHGDCLEVLRDMEACSVDAVVTDPPYGLSFMGKRWDYDVPTVEIWAECLRVLKPGGHLLAFAGTRTQHRMAVRIEDAGFEIRDMIAWVYGSGFPKSRNLDGKWKGWGTALKPALEPITVARKPLAGTVAENVLQWGTGGLNVDGCRIATQENLNGGAYSKSGNRRDLPGAERSATSAGMMAPGKTADKDYEKPTGRWPANLIHDGSDEVMGLFPLQQSGANPTRRGGMGYHGADGQDSCVAPRGVDSGSAARFFYNAKATKAERKGSNHPTIKPLNLMRYLCRLVTPPGGIVLDPFMGTGTTIEAALAEGFQAVGIELDPVSFEDAQRRLNGSQLRLTMEVA